MKNILKTALFGIALTTCFMSYPHTSSAADSSNDSTEQQQTTPKKHHHHGFRLGVCVGRTLGGAPGEKADPATFKAAIESCKTQFKSKAASANPDSNS